MNQKNNQGYQNTHQKIKDCLNQLLMEKNLDQITIQEICLEAKVNRSTFYAHYKDIYDVLEQIGFELNKKLLARYEKIAAKQALSELDYIPPLLEHFKEYRRFYHVLLANPNNPVLTESLSLLQKEIQKPILEHYHVDERSGSYYFNYVKAGFLAVIWQWIKDGCPESPQKMAEILMNLRPSLPGNLMPL